MNLRLLAFAVSALLAVPLSAQNEGGSGGEAGGEVAGDVEILRLPRGAKRPQAVVDEQGTLHVVYFKPAGRGKGELHYVARASDADSWSKPIRVNTNTEGGPFASVAVGEKGRVHVVWMLMNPIRFMYTRLANSGKKFHKAKDVLTKGAEGLEAPPSVAADGDGNVVIIWHEGDFKKEDERVVWMRRSGNGGKTFDRGRAVNPEGSGVCACCRQDMAVGTDGVLYIVFRQAKDKVGRDMVLLTSTDFGKTCEAEVFDTWELNRCPTQAGQIAIGPDGKAAVIWKNKEMVKFAPIDKLSEWTPTPAGKAARNFVTVNAQGEILLAWIAGQRANQRLRWQVYGADGKPTDAKGNLRLNERTMPTGVVLPSGKFALIY